MTDATADLMAALEGEPVTGPIDPDGATSDHVTEWVAQVVRLQKRKDEYEAAHKAAVAKLGARLAERNAALDEQIAWLMDALSTYHRVVLANDPDAKTIHTPAGTIKSRKAQDRFVVEDEDAFKTWATAAFPAAVEFPAPKVKLVEAKKLMKNGRISDQRLIVDGETIPGVRVIQATEDDRKFSVTED